MGLSTMIKEAIVHLWLLASLPQPKYKLAQETETGILLGTQNIFHLCYSDLLLWPDSLFSVFQDFLASLFPR